MVNNMIFNDRTRCCKRCCFKTVLDEPPVQVKHKDQNGNKIQTGIPALRCTQQVTLKYCTFTVDNVFINDKKQNVTHPNGNTHNFIRIISSSNAICFKYMFTWMFRSRKRRKSSPLMLSIKT
ncbi:hypothetical protein T05_4371 [Trichinella murrelli]|uniref:Uncharacterized protein n=1 Tax=Trichinella murrelli TaxID=144512 RepID=A0A0V0TBA8_9BILA|nr:hypothetical protein T05_4371 [Trichinella murrelli]